MIKATKNIVTRMPIFRSERQKSIVNPAAVISNGLYPIELVKM